MSSWITDLAEDAMTAAREAWKAVKSKRNPRDFELYRVIARLYGGLDICISHLISLRRRSVPPDYAAKLTTFLDAFPSYKRYRIELGRMLEYRHCYTHYYERRKVGQLTPIRKGETYKLLGLGLKLGERLVSELLGR